MVYRRKFILWVAVVTVCVACVALATRFQPDVVLAQTASVQDGPILRITDGLLVREDGLVTVPISFKTNGEEVTALSFSIDFDETCLAFDPTDADDNGKPDAVTLHTPTNMSAAVMVDLQDTDSEIDILVADIFPPFILLPDTPQFVELTFRAVCTPPPGGYMTAAVAFSDQPLPSFGGTMGNAIIGTALSSVVSILSKIPATSTPTATYTATSTPTFTPTLTPTPTSTATSQFVPTRPTASPTATLIPTAAPLTLVNHFTAKAEIDGVLLHWETSQEFNTRTFKIQRLVLGQGDTFRLLIGERPSKGPQGGTYHYFDNTAEADRHYTYLLIEEKQSGELLAYYDIAATVRPPFQPQPEQRVWLPLILR